MSSSTSFLPPSADRILYTRPDCPGCVQLKAKLREEGKPFLEMEIGKDLSLEDFQAQYPGVRSVPYLVVQPGS